MSLAEPPVVPDRQLRRNAIASVADGAAYSVGVGMGEHLFPAFVLAIGLGDAVAALTTTLPLLAGAILQMASPMALRWARSYRVWVVFCCALQSLSFIPILYIVHRGQSSAALWLALATVYWAAGMAAGPAWNTWIAHLIPPSMRSRFFSVRSSLAQGATLIGLLISMAMLSTMTTRDQALHGFLVLFAGAGICRFLSTCFLTLQSECPVHIVAEQYVSPLGMVRRLRTDTGRLIVYMLCMQAALHMSVPFQNPYMLRHLGMDRDYTGWVILIAVPFTVKLLLMPWMGTLANRFGARRLLWVGGVGVVPMGVIWLFSEHFGYLLGVQILTGVTMGAYELATLLLLFSTIPQNERTSIMALYALGNALAVVAGSAVGAAFIRHLGEVPAAYQYIFAISTIARLATLPLLRGVSQVSTRSVLNGALRVFWPGLPASAARLVVPGRASETTTVNLADEPRASSLEDVAESERTS